MDAQSQEEAEETWILLMMKAMDGRLVDEDERKLWETHLKENPERAREFARFTSTSTYLNDFRDRKLYEHHNRTRRAPNRTLAWVGLGLLLVGLGVLWAFALGPSLIEPGSWLGMELGAGIAALGVLVLLVKLIRR